MNRKPKTPGKTLFDHLNAIYTDQRIEYFDELTDAEQREFVVYMINRFLSMNPAWTQIVNEMQVFYSAFGPRETYLFYSQLLPKGKQFHRYIKGAKEVSTEPWLVDAVACHFEVSTFEAQNYINMLFQSDAGKAELKAICKTFNISDKKLKKVKL